MIPISTKFYPGVDHKDNPGQVTADLFQDYDFGNLEVLDSDGADSCGVAGSPYASSRIRFYTQPEEGDGDSVPMLFSVEFSPKGAQVSVYSP